MTGIFNSNSHPARDFIFFLAVVVFTIWLKNPFVSFISVFCGLVVNGVLKNWKAFKVSAGVIPFFLFLSILNPLVSHWGNTTLFTVWGKPFTKEALFYGLNMGLVFAAIVEWFCAAGRVLTVEKFTFLFSPVFPAVSLMMSMILRTIPFISNRSAEVRQARAGIGIKPGLKEVSAVFLSVLEDGVFTARTMEDRGYGKKKRTAFLQYKFCLGDFFCLLIYGILLVAVVWGWYSGSFEINFYPDFYLKEFWNDRAGLIPAAAFSVFCLMPAFEIVIRKK